MFRLGLERKIWCKQLSGEQMFLKKRLERSTRLAGYVDGLSNLVQQKESGQMGTLMYQNIIVRIIQCPNFTFHSIWHFNYTLIKLISQGWIPV